LEVFFLAGRLTGRRINPHIGSLMSLVFQRKRSEEPDSPVCELTDISVLKLTGSQLIVAENLQELPLFLINVIDSCQSKKIFTE